MDLILMRIADIISAIPSMLYVILLTLVMGAGIGSMILGLCVAGWIGMARMVRGEILKLKEMEYAYAARMEGIRPMRILVRHLLPNAAGTIIVNLIFLVPQAIFTEAFLSFLGVGIEAPAASLGTIIQEARSQMMLYPYQMVFPLLVLCVMLLALNMAGTAAEQKAGGRMETREEEKTDECAGSKEPERAVPGDGRRIRDREGYQFYSRRRRHHRDRRPVRFREKHGYAGGDGAAGRTRVRAVRADHGEGKAPAPGRNIAMIFQDSLSCLNPSVKIGRQITETVRTRKGCGRKEAAARAEELLETVGIRNPALRMRQYPFELSGGMRQRVVLAIALACEPDLIIADEPTTALDAVVQAQILQLLRRIVRETGTALLLVSHDMGVTAAMCRNVYVMHGGRIIEEGTAEDIFYDRRKDIRSSFLRMRKAAGCGRRKKKYG